MVVHGQARNAAIEDRRPGRLSLWLRPTGDVIRIYNYVRPGRDADVAISHYAVDPCWSFIVDLNGELFEKNPSPKNDLSRHLGFGAFLPGDPGLALLHVLALESSARACRRCRQRDRCRFGLGVFIAVGAAGLAPGLRCRGRRTLFIGRRPTRHWLTLEDFIVGALEGTFAPTKASRRSSCSPLSAVGGRASIDKLREFGLGRTG